MFELIHFRWLLILLMVGSSLVEINPASSLALISPELNGHQDSLIADWQSIFRRYRPRRPLTSRGGICAIAPGLVGEVKVWSDRPLLIWNGAASQVKIRDRESRQELWMHRLNPSENYVVYNGEPLEAGKRYQWQILNENPSGSDLSQWYTFEVIAEDDRSQIATDLQALKRPQETGEAIALRQAEYFAEKELWSDALQILYTAESTEAIVQARQDLLNILCPSSPSLAF